MDKSIDFLKSLDLGDSYIIVGCSGGPDSMCLLNLLIEESYPVICAHINHNIRKESKDEFKFLKDYCKKRNVIFEGLEIPHYENKNESFYRTKRYTFYKDLCKKYKTGILMTAHHGDDLTETILMRITRGSKLRGYSGFSKDYYEYGIRIIKPLIFYSKDDILEYNRANGIPYVLDKTNDEDTYTRNRYRHKILPFLKSESDSVHLKYLSYSEELESACDFIDRMIEEALKENYSGSCIDLTRFEDLDIFLKKKELEAIFKDLYRDDIDKIKSQIVDKIICLLETGKNFSMDLPLNFTVRREYNKLLFIEKRIVSKPFEFDLSRSLVLDNGYTIEIVEKSDDTSNYTTRLYSKDISLPLKVRSRHAGDRIQIKNMEGSKKVKNVMIDDKVPPSLRDTYPIVVDNDDNILWLPGLRKSKFDSELSGKYDIILRYTKKGEKIDEKK